MTLEVKFKVRVQDLLDHIDRTYGGLAGLRRHLDPHEDAPRVLLNEVAHRHGDHPNRIITLGRMYFGGPRSMLSAARFEVLDYLMQNPGPSLRELARGLGRSPATVAEHLEELEAEGRVTRERRGPGRPVTLRALPLEVEITLTGKAPRPGRRPAPTAAPPSAPARRPPARGAAPAARRSRRRAG